MAEDVFAALADPTRRHILGRLADSGPATATSLSAELSITRQAVAKHLGVLAGAGMARSKRIGRETRYEADLTSLVEVQLWIAEIENDWTTRLAALAESLRPID